MNQPLPAYARIAAVIPCYNDTGDSTLIIAADGTTTPLISGIRAVIHRLARSRAIDLSALKANTRSTTERKNLGPLPLAPGLVLVPVKVRQPRVSGDTTIGYVNFHMVTNVYVTKNKPYQAAISLSGKTEIPVLWTAATVNRQLTLARLAANTSPTSQPLTIGAFRETFPGYAPELLTIAVKLVDVFNEILNVKQNK